MTEINRRDILAVIASVAAVTATPGLAHASGTTLDLSAGKAIGEAYLKANPGIGLAALRQAHLPSGLSVPALVRARNKVAADFREGRVFVHEGWRLSVTEAQLFALLALRAT